MRRNLMRSIAAFVVLALLAKGAQGDDFPWSGWDLAQSALSKAKNTPLGITIALTMAQAEQTSHDLDAAFSGSEGVAKGTPPTETAGGAVSISDDPSGAVAPGEVPGVMLAGNDTVGSDANKPILSGSPTHSGDDPVVNGELVYQHVDVELPGRGIPFRFLRTYRNRVRHLGVLGWGWDFNFNRRVVASKNSCGDVEVLTGDSGRVHFNFVNSYTGNPGAIHYTAQAGVALTLRKDVALDDNNSVWVMTDRGGMTYTFDHEGALQTIADAAGNTLKFEWERIKLYGDRGRTGTVVAYDSQTSKQVSVPDPDVVWRIRVVTDTVGRRIYFNYPEIANPSPATQDHPPSRRVFSAASASLREAARRPSSVSMSTRRRVLLTSENSMDSRMRTASERPTFMIIRAQSASMPPTPPRMLFAPVLVADQTIATTLPFATA